MSLDFSGSGAPIVDCGVSPELNDLDKGTMWCWARPYSVESSTIQVLGSKGYFGGTGRTLMFRNGELRFSLGRATQNLLLRSDDTVSDPLGNVPRNNLTQFFAATWDVSLGASGQKLYRGQINVPVSEMGYQLQRLGSGATESDSGKVFTIGDDSNQAGRVFDGSICSFGVHSDPLSLEDLMWIQYSLVVHDPVTTIGLWEILDDADACDDSLSGNHGTVTDAVYSEFHPPLPIDEFIGDEDDIDEPSSFASVVAEVEASWALSGRAAGTGRVLAGTSVGAPGSTVTVRGLARAIVSGAVAVTSRAFTRGLGAVSAASSVKTMGASVANVVAQGGVIAGASFSALSSVVAKAFAIVRPFARVSSRSETITKATGRVVAQASLSTSSTVVASVASPAPAPPPTIVEDVAAFQDTVSESAQFNDAESADGQFQDTFSSKDSFGAPVDATKFPDSVMDQEKL